MKCCKTCKWIQAGVNKAGRRYISKRYPYKCLKDIDIQELPYSMTKCYGFWPPKKESVYWDEGKNCPCWEEYKK